MLKALIVDDEPIARKVLREELDEFDNITVVGEAADGETALKIILDCSPDLVFLDLQVPVLSGLEVLRRLTPGPMPAIIVVTALEGKARDALRAGAVAYVLKPVHPARLQLAMNYALGCLCSSNANNKLMYCDELAT